MTDLTALTRRHFLSHAGVGLGGIALLSMLLEDAARGAPAAPADPLAPKRPHFAATAKRVIFLGQLGAPSQLDLFDHKPELRKRDGHAVPASLVAGQEFVFIGNGRTQFLASPW